MPNDYPNPFASLPAALRQKPIEFMLQVCHAALNSVIYVNMPNPWGKTAQGSKKQLSAKHVNQLKKRIRTDILGPSGKVRTGAVSRHDGRTALRIQGGGGDWPLIVPRGRKPKNLKIRSALPYILSNSNWVQRKRQMVRVPRVAAGHSKKWVWTTRKSIMDAVKELQSAAGAFIGGWKAAAESVNAPSLSRALPKSTRATWSGRALKPLMTMQGDVMWSGTNSSAPSLTAARKQQAYIHQRLKSEANYYAQTFLPYFVKSIKKHLKALS